MWRQQRSAERSLSRSPEKKLPSEGNWYLPLSLAQGHFESLEGSILIYRVSHPDKNSPIRAGLKAQHSAAEKITFDEGHGIGKFAYGEQSPAEKIIETNHQDGMGGAETPLPLHSTKDEPVLYLGSTPAGGTRRNTVQIRPFPPCVRQL